MEAFITLLLLCAKQDLAIVLGKNLTQTMMQKWRRARKQVKLLGVVIRNSNLLESAKVMKLLGKSVAAN
jgi:hypothetical protein